LPHPVRGALRTTRPTDWTDCHWGLVKGLGEVKGSRIERSVAIQQASMPATSILD
jgi:hypothetical protein